jgi:thymidylate synthase (FAD)
MQVDLISATESFIEGINSPEDLISYIARVSNPSNQLNTETAPRLLKYLIKHKHWSPFEQVSLTFQIITSRAIAAQIIRHRSFCFQEFSQRYSQINSFESFELRKQAEKNRQSSQDLFELGPKDVEIIKNHLVQSAKIYDELIEKGAAKECARMLLPLCTQTTLYMTGNLRSWLSYLNVRLEDNTQLEHREIALAISKVIAEMFPNTTEALDNFNEFKGNFM